MISRFYRPRLYGPSVALFLGMLPIGAAPVAASPILISQSFTPPPNSGAPPSTTAGASRGAECQARPHATVITPLMPKVSTMARAGEQRKRRNKQQHFSLTLQERPSFFWHVKPQVADSTASFLLLERDGRAPLGKQFSLVYEAELDLPSTPGIVRLDLPKAVPALRPDRQYEWFLSFNCDPDSLDSQVHLSGWVELVTPSADLSQQLKTASLAEKAQILADSGIWQDALMTQIRLREVNPNRAQVEDNWRIFLNSVGLGELATAPLLSARITEILAY